jgi:hypothetical protein
VLNRARCDWRPLACPHSKYWSPGRSRRRSMGNSHAISFVLCDQLILHIQALLMHLLLTRASRAKFVAEPILEAIDLGDMVQCFYRPKKAPAISLCPGFAVSFFVESVAQCPTYSVDTDKSGLRRRLFAAESPHIPILFSIPLRLIRCPCINHRRPIPAYIGIH